MTRSAYCLIRSQPDYRREAFAAGLEAAGYQCRFHPPTAYKPDDVLLIWNRYANNDVYAQRMNAAGGTVLVAENGYLGRDWRGEHWYALAMDRHNGAGDWYVGGAHRWHDLNVGMDSWRKEGDHVLVLLQRGIGVAPVAQPATWERDLRKELPKLTPRPIKWRGHPGEKKSHETLYDDLRGAHCVVTWGSGGALKALTVGVPVFYGFTQWIGAGAGLPIGHDIERPLLDDAARLAMFERLAWAMWSTDELATGYPFECLTKKISHAA